MKEFFKNTDLSLSLFKKREIEIIKKTTRIILIYLFSLAGFSTLTSYATTSNNSGSFNFANNITVNGQVIEIDLPASNMKFSISWIDSNGRAWVKEHFSIKGKHLYEMRDHPMWNGVAKAISVNSSSVISGELITPSIKDELSIFFLPELWLRSSVNALWGHSLFGYSFTILLSLLMGFVTLALFFIKKMKIPLPVSILAGFIFSWIVMDCRTIYDHYLISRDIKENLSIRQTEGLRLFSLRLSEKIGKKIWTRKELPMIASINLDYSLAEQRYSTDKDKDEANFIITDKGGGIVLLPGRSGL